MSDCLVCRADHIGSLLRPKALKTAYKARAAGKIDAATFEETLGGAIERAIRMQEAAGLGAITDGEFRRRSWFAGFVDAVDGLVHKDTQFNFMERGEAAIAVMVPHTEAPIRRNQGIATREFAFAKERTTRPVKITLPAPSVIHFFRGPEGIDRAVYPDEDQWWRDLIHVYRAELAELGRLGCTYVQLDEVPIALLCDAKIQERIAQWGWSWKGLLNRYVDAINLAVAGRPAGMRIGVHLCRGNFRGRWIGSGGYEPVAETLFNRAEVDHFLLEYDSARAGDFRPLRHLPKDRGVVLGLVSSKTPELESDDFVKHRIDEASAHIASRQLGLSPQCGFGTTVGGAPMTEDEERRKLDLVGRVARSVWG